MIKIAFQLLLKFLILFKIKKKTINIKEFINFVYVITIAYIAK